MERGVTLEPYPFLEFGEHVRVRSGVLESLEGVISRCKSGSRLVAPIFFY